MAAVGKKLHHTVPRFYLKAWAKDNRVYCLHDGQIFLANVRNVGAENHFYRLHELSEEDVSLIRHLAIDKSPEKLKPSHERLVRAFALPHSLKRQLQDSGKANPERLALIDKAIAELNENLHTSIEADFKPYLDSMLGGDISFYADPARSSLFLRGIAAQYLRTNILDKARESLGPQRVPTFRRIMNVLVHIFAINLGLSLFLDRERYRITPLNSQQRQRGSVCNKRPANHQSQGSPQNHRSAGAM